MITIDNERDTVYQETARYLKKIANETLERSAFELPEILSLDLRRYLKKQAQ